MKLEDYVKQTPNVKTTIHWWELYNGHFIKIESSLQKKIFGDALDRCDGSFTLLGKKLGISRRTISSCSKLQRSSNIFTIKKIANYINFPFLEIEKYIINIGKSHFEPKLPFKLHNIEGAEIRAAFLSDGHIPVGPTISPIYSAFEKELHWRLINLCKKVFGEFNSIPRQGHKTPQTRFPAPISTALELSGVPRGDKRLSQIFVPRDILLGCKEIKSCYLRRVFDDEGDVGSGEKRYVRITRSVGVASFKLDSTIQNQRWTSTNRQLPYNYLLLGELLLLQSFGIDAKMYPEGVYKSKNNKITAKWRINVIQQDRIKLFNDIIGFNLREKQTKLLKMINSYKVKEFPNYYGEIFSTNILKQIHDKKGFFTFGDLGNELVKTGRSYDLAGRYLRILQRKGKINKIKRGIYVFR